jgi:triacylglycerol lipase
MNVILVHGIFNRGGIMARLGRSLTEAGHTCFAPSLKPCDARTGLPVLAEQLRQFVDATLPGDSPFAVVGLSMGAIVARFYLQELNGCTRTRAFFSIAGPHAGTRLAYIYPTVGGRELRPNSAFLKRLQTTVTRLAGVPITCYWTPYDIMIRPLASTRLHGADHVRIPSPLHSLLVFDRRLHLDIACRLERLKTTHRAVSTEASLGRG